ncbi:MAG: STAS domain-containing protein [Selenomonadaceae bacterium]|nr:STAS domain-containing protein [Selenomonadaceae bacterium]
MEVKKFFNESKLTMKISGRIDTNTSVQLNKEIKGSIEGVSNLIFDLDDVTYISSAALRVFLSAGNIMKQQGKMSIINANSDLMDVFNVTGFTEIIDIHEK